MTFTDATAPIQQQIGPGSPIPSGLKAVTSPLYPPQNLMFRLRNFPEEVYNLNPASHLFRLLGVLLGDAGGEGLRKQSLMSRLHTTLSGTSFLNLDAFWGALFNLNRVAGESYPTNPLTGNPLNPHTDSAMPAVWNMAHQADAYFRSRIFQFAQALSYGPSPVGIKKTAEAVLNTPVDLYEVFQSQPSNYIATIVPHRPITQAEMYNLYSVLQAIMPADALITITQGAGQAANVIPLAQAWADSSYWEVVAQVTPGPNSLYSVANSTRPRWMYSAYQGEQWELNSEITVVTSASWDYLGNLLMTPDFQHFVWPDGSFTNFTPDLSVMPGWQLELGRLAQSGVTSVNPFVVGNANPSAQVLMDGMSMAALGSLIQGNAQVSQPQQNNFWVTPPRLGSDNTQDVVTYSFKQPHLVNQFNFQVANYPHSASLWVQDPPSGNWYEVGGYTVQTCAQSVFGDASNLLANKLHPQLTSTNAWIPMAVRMNPALVQNMQIRLQRFSGIGPFDTLSNPAPYCLGVQNFAVQFTLDNQTMLPVGPGPIDSTLNLLEDQVTYVSYRESPNNVLNAANSQTSFTLGSGLTAGTPYTSITASAAVSLNKGSFLIFNHQQIMVTSMVSNSTTIPIETFTPGVNYANGQTIQVARCQWRSSPQSSADAVVNYYVDSRSTTGPQVIDHFYVEPTHAGVTCNLYWSNGPPTTSGKATNMVLTPTVTGVIPTTTGLSLSATASSNMTLAAVNPILSNSWWVGWNFTPAASISQYVGWGLNGTANSHSVNVTAGGVAAISTSFGSGLQIGGVVPAAENSLVFGYVAPGDPTDLGPNPDGILYLGLNGQYVTAPVATAITPAAMTLTFGSTVSGWLDAGYVINDFVLKGEPLTNATAQAYMTNSTPYCYKGQYGFQDTGLTNDSYVRFDPSLIDPIYNPYGFVGGTPDYLAGMEWVPLVKDFILTRGDMNFRPTLANFWKFEMSNLVPEPYSVFLPQIQGINQTFGIGATTPGVGDSLYQGSISSTTSAVQAQANGQPQFFTSTTPTAEPDPRLSTPTTTLVATTPNVAQALANQFFNFGYTDWHQSQAMPVNTSGGITSYVTNSTNQTQQVAFFCGFYMVQARRTNPAAPIDTPIYYERFLDESNYIF